MNSYKNKFIYWTLLSHKHWQFHIAATENGLCFIGSQNENFEELNIWARKKLPQHILTCNPNYLQTYTKEIIEYLEIQREAFTFPIDAYGPNFNYLFGIRYVKFLMGRHILIQKLPKQYKSLLLCVPLLPLLLPILFLLQFLAIVLLERMVN